MVPENLSEANTERKHGNNSSQKQWFPNIYLGFLGIEFTFGSLGIVVRTVRNTVNLCVRRIGNEILRSCGCWRRRSGVWRWCCGSGDVKTGQWRGEHLHNVPQKTRARTGSH